MKKRCGSCKRPLQIGDISCSACKSFLFEYVREAPGTGVYDNYSEEPGAEDEALDWKLGGPLGDINFELPPGRCMMLHGVAGGGKTRMSLVFLGTAKSKGRKFSIVTNEMEPEDYVRYGESLGVRISAEDVYEAVHATAEDAEEMENVIEGSIIGFRRAGTEEDADPAELGDLIFDSLSETPEPVEAARNLVAYAKAFGARCIGIVQENVDGTPKGGTKIPHLFWSQVRIETDEGGNAIARVVKNRSYIPGSPTQVVLNVGSGTMEEMAASYYTVEGKVGAYHLLLWPDRKSTWDGVYRVAGDPKHPLHKRYVGLRDAPLAVANRLSPLDKVTGFAEPADWQKRAAFALGMGVPFYSPSHGLFETPADLEAYDENDEPESDEEEE